MKKNNTKRRRVRITRSKKVKKQLNIVLSRNKYTCVECGEKTKKPLCECGVIHNISDLIDYTIVEPNIYYVHSIFNKFFRKVNPPEKVKNADITFYCDKYNKFYILQSRSICGVKFSSPHYMLCKIIDFPKRYRVLCNVDSMQEVIINYLIRNRDFLKNENI